MGTVASAAVLDLHDLLILVHNDVACAVRDILGIVKTTKNHTNATIKALFSPAGLNLYLVDVSGHSSTSM